ncbi:MAG: aminotransferase class I/II-fold pyridoxal phosphate-dependent enzyme [Erysipelotrichaceae bacterium]|nr:aminotransferase class I/II-fold pyridoxal phosphate-dependent enzyme [Erysipelotrichaceae bacterium]
MKSFSKLLDTFDEGIFKVLTDKRIELENKGKIIYDLYVGTPDFEPDIKIKRALSDSCLISDDYKYSLRIIPELKEEFIKYYQNRFNVSLNSFEISMCNGTQEGMCHIGMCLCDKDDYCLLPDPGYPAFKSSAILAGANIHYYPLLEENDFMPRLDLIDEEILKKTKYVIISYPSNPTGGVITKERYMEIISLAKKYDFIIINDNAYSDIVYDGFQSFSFLELPGAKDVGVEFYSLSKSFNTTGARISFLIGNEKIVKAFEKLRSQYDFGMFIPIQRAAIEALKLDRNIVLKQQAIYEERRNALCDGLNSIGWKVKKPNGTMFVFAKIPSEYNDSMDFSMALLNKANVLVTPGIAFGPLGDKYVRFALVKDKDELLKIVDVIKNANIIKRSC